MKWRSGIQLTGKVSIIGFSTMILLYAAALLSLRLMGFDYAVVISDSMSPVAKRGDLVLINEHLTPKLDDVALFHRGSSLVVHRIVHQSDEGWITKGDANQVSDPWVVPESDVLGVGEGVIKGFGAPLLWLGDRFSAPARATLVDTAKIDNQIVSSWWAIPPATWTMPVSNISVTFQNPANVSIQGSGVRKVYSSTKFFADTHIKGMVTSTNFDNAADWIRFIINGCTNYTNIVTCGYAITVDKSAASMTLAGIKSNATLTAPIASCAILLKPGSVQQFRFSILKNQNEITVSSNRQKCFSVSNLSQAAATVGAAPVSGGYAGVWVEQTTRIELSPLFIW